MNLYTWGFILVESVVTLAARYLLSQGIHPYFFGSITGVIAGGMMLTYFLFTNKKKRAVMKLSTIKAVLPTAIFIALANGFGFVSLQLIPAVKYALITRINVLIAPLLAWLILKEKLDKRVFGLIGVAFIGVLFLSGIKNAETNISGDLLGLLAALSLAGDFVWQKKAALKIPTEIVAFWRRLLSALFIGVLWLLLPNLGSADWQLLPELILFAFGYAVLGILVVKAIASQSMADFNLYSNLSPVLIGSLGFVLLGEWLSQRQLFGAAIILGGIFIYSLKNKIESRKLQERV